ncbi:alpha/beta fold hydrolase [Streptomyces sp. RKAG293]|uniref:alpha/beta fold hydrolase n=1 Tax=Streptomyces sp. RKAG293 TaxID=2893403 RepID=UPI0020337A2D|nr:alpha/beta hydrolase [Streptomyces sp. RKAG293]MCM2416766.1 alpha/beta hydrolase [Streptomyces sp. RKAG293]
MRPAALVQEDRTMSHHVLLVGTSALLTGRLAARRLAAPDRPSVLLLLAARSRPTAPGPDAAALRSFVRDDVAGSAPGTAPDDPGDRLRILRLDPDALAEALAAETADEVWCVTPGLDRDPARGAWADGVVAGALLAALPALRAAKYVHVGPSGAGGADRLTPPPPPYRELERTTVERCLAHGAAWRVLRTPPVADAAAPLLGESPAGPHQLLEALRSVRSEVADRIPDWFQRHPLRVAGFGGRGLALLPAGRAAEWLWATGGPPGLPDGFATLPCPVPTPLEELLPRAGAVYGIDLRPVTGRDGFTAAERLLDLRLDAVRSAAVRLGGSAADDAPEALSVAAQWELLGAVRENQDRSAARTPPRGPARTVEVAGAPLTLFEAGAARAAGQAPLVLINALGQGHGFLDRLSRELAAHRRVVSWQVRGTDPDLPPWDIDHQLDDLRAVLGLTGAERFHLVGWCTGAKIATAYQRRHPGDVASLVFLNATFKQDGLWDGMDTPYERNLEAVCRALARRPEKAERLVGLLAPGSAGGGEKTGPGQDAGVLGVLSRALAEEVRRPFLAPEKLVRYARQLVDLWTLDTAEQAPAVEVPVLFVGSEFDAISSPARARAAARCFPDARYAELAGAGHYAPHDRSALVAELITEFVRAPGRIAREVAHPEIRWGVEPPGPEQNPAREAAS